jgi:hypothetical protein
MLAVMVKSGRQDHLERRAAIKPGLVKKLTEIVQIGAQVEIITNSLAYLRQGALVDSGLPIVVNIPEHVQIRPGEAVDMLIKPLAEQTNAIRLPDPKPQGRQVSQMRLRVSP